MSKNEELIRKKTVLVNMKQTLKQMSSLGALEFIEADNPEISKYAEYISEMNKFSYKRNYIKSLKSEDSHLIEWFMEVLPFIDNKNVWLMPFEGMGIWWVKVEVLDSQNALKELWSLGEICAVDLSNKTIFIINVNESDCEVAIKRL